MLQFIALLLYLVYSISYYNPQLNNNFIKMKYLRKVKFSENIYSPDYSTTLIHGFLKKDKFNLLKFSEEYRSKVVEREIKNSKQWNKYIEPSVKDWMYNTMELINKNSKNSKSQIKDQEIDGYIYFEKMINKIKVLYRKNKSTNKEEKIFSIESLKIDKKFHDTSNFKLLRVKNDTISFIIEIDNNEMTISGIYDIKNKTFNSGLFMNVSNIEFSDNNSIFILKNDENFRPFEIIKYDFVNEKEMKVFNSSNSNEYLEMSKSCENDFLFINSVTKDDSEVFFIDLKTQLDGIKINTLFKRMKKTKYFVDYFDGHFYILSNLNRNITYNLNENSVGNDEYSKNSYSIKPEKFYSKYKLYKLELDLFKRNSNNTNQLIFNNLKLLIEPQDYEYLEEMHLIKDHVILFGKLNLVPSIIIYQIKDEKLSIFSVEGLLGSINSGMIEVRLFYDN